MASDRKCITGSSGVRRIASLVPAFAFAFTVAIMLPVSTDSGFSVNGAFAAGNGGGNGKGKGKGKALGQAGAPGQQADQVADADEHAGVSGSAAAEAGSSEIDGETPLILTDANNQVIQELAGLPESSALSEEEELEAIRNGWGTWRTADGPDSVTVQ